MLRLCFIQQLYQNDDIYTKWKFWIMDVHFTVLILHLYQSFHISHKISILYSHAFFFLRLQRMLKHIQCRFYNHHVFYFDLANSMQKCVCFTASCFKKLYWYTYIDLSSYILLFLSDCLSFNFILNHFFMNNFTPSYLINYAVQNRSIRYSAFRFRFKQTN